MKKSVSFFLAVILVIALAACGSSQSKQDKFDDQSDVYLPSKQEAEGTWSSVPTTIRIGVPTAPPTLPILHMIETKALGDNVTIKLDIWDEAETLIAMVQDGKHDMFAFPLTVVSKLYNKGLDVRLMNVNTWGVTYFMTSDPEFDEWSDLKGKTVYIPLQSSPPDVLTQYFLANAGLKVGTDVNVVYTTTAEVAAMLASGDAVYATLIEPQVTKAMMANPNLRVAFSFEKEWQEVNNTQTMIPNAGFGTTQQFIDENPELVKKFQKAYEEAVIWVNENPDEIGELAERYLGLKKELIVKSLPNMGLAFKNSIDSKDEINMLFQLLFDFNPKMIGGSIPDAGMYYDEE